MVIAKVGWRAVINTAIKALKRGSSKVRLHNQDRCGVFPLSSIYFVIHYYNTESILFIIAVARWLL